MSKSRIKTLLCVFFDVQGIVHFEFVPQGKAVNAAFYLEAGSPATGLILAILKLHHENDPQKSVFHNADM
ncbi:hypothetical protein J6590_107611, partial [Homalodisca vitripennis]